MTCQLDFSNRIRSQLSNVSIGGFTKFCKSGYMVCESDGISRRRFGNGPIAVWTGGEGTFSEKLRTSACRGMAIKSLRERRRWRKCESHYRNGDPLVRNLASPRLRKPWYLFRSIDPIHWNPRNSSYRQIEGFSTVSMENRIFRMGYFKRGDLFVLLYWGISKKIFVVEECIIWM